MMQRQIDKFGDNGILFRWPDSMSKEVYLELLAFDEFLRKEYRGAILETIVAYNSLAAFLNDDYDVESFLADFQWQDHDVHPQISEASTYIVPVCYESHFAPDLPRVAEYCEMREEDVVQLHSSVTYDVRFIGFLPGFPYLAGLDRRLHTPRVSDPRRHISKGSVGIGGEQTGIYTLNSPGGWNIIGKSPLSFFNVNNDPPSLFMPGDKIVFKAISSREFEEMERQVCQGSFELQKLV